MVSLSTPPLFDRYFTLVPVNSGSAKKIAFLLNFNKTEILPNVGWKRKRGLSLPLLGNLCNSLQISRYLVQRETSRCLWVSTKCLWINRHLVETINIYRVNLWTEKCLAKRKSVAFGEIIIARLKVSYCMHTLNIIYINTIKGGFVNFSSMQREKIKALLVACGELWLAFGIFEAPPQQNYDLVT